MKEEENRMRFEGRTEGAEADVKLPGWEEGRSGWGSRKTGMMEGEQDEVIERRNQKV